MHLVFPLQAQIFSMHRWKRIPTDTKCSSTSRYKSNLRRTNSRWFPLWEWVQKFISTVMLCNMPISKSSLGTEIKIVAVTVSQVFFSVLSEKIECSTAVPKAKMCFWKAQSTSNATRAKNKTRHLCWLQWQLKTQQVPLQRPWILLLL